MIGVNAAIYSPTGGSVGIRFAIPSSVVKQVVGQLEANGKVERGWVGVAAQPVSPTMAKALNLPGDTVRWWPRCRRTARPRPPVFSRGT